MRHFFLDSIGNDHILYCTVLFCLCNYNYLCSNHFFYHYLKIFALLIANYFLIFFRTFLKICRAKNSSVHIFLTFRKKLVMLVIPYWIQLDSVREIGMHACVAFVLCIIIVIFHKKNNLIFISNF